MIIVQISGQMINVHKLDNYVKDFYMFFLCRVGTKKQKALLLIKGEGANLVDFPS